MIARHPRELPRGRRATSSRPTPSAARRWCWPSTGSAAQAHEINRAAARARARGGGRGSRTPERPRCVAGSIGPDHQGDLGHRRRHLRGADRELRRPGAGRCSRAAPTTSCSRPARTPATSRPALLGIEQAFAEPGERVPVAVSGTIEPMGTMLAGQSVEALAASLEHVDLLYLGLNCATGPEFMTDHIRSLARARRVPGRLRAERRPAGRERPLPRDAGDARRASLARFVEQGWLNLVGGCCGTHAGAHRRRSPRRSRGLKPPRGAAPRRALRALRAWTTSRSPTTMRPVIVGERTNVIGSQEVQGADRRREVRGRRARSPARR